MSECCERSRWGCSQELTESRREEDDCGSSTCTHCSNSGPTNLCSSCFDKFEYSETESLSFSLSITQTHTHAAVGECKQSESAHSLLLLCCWTSCDTAQPLLGRHSLSTQHMFMVCYCSHRNGCIRIDGEWRSKETGGGCWGLCLAHSLQMYFMYYIGKVQTPLFLLLLG